VDGHPNSFAAKITRKLAELRRSEKVTIEQLAERLDSSPQSVQRIEKGQNITLRTLYRIASAMGFTVSITFVRDPKGPRKLTVGKRRDKKIE
jgi:transcriptional regulator with XRE-family HTH domain